MAVATNTALGTVLLAGDLAGSSNANSPQLTPTGVTPGVYKGTSVVVDAKGRILHARSLANYDVGCATTTECGIVSVTDHHNIDLTDKKISIKKASQDEYGVVKLGQGFGKDCCEIFVDYDRATNLSIGAVIVPTSGNLVIDGAGNISVPTATTTTIGLVKAVNGNGLTLTDGTLTFTPPDATTSSKGYVQIYGNSLDALKIAAGQMYIENASSSGHGAFRMDNSFTFTSNTYSYPNIATSGALGLVKIGTGIYIDAEGIISRGATTASTSVKGIVQVQADNGLNVSGGLLTFTPSDASASVKGVVQLGANIVNTAGVLSLANANGTGTKGIVAAAPTGNLTISNGVIDIGPNIMLIDAANVFTKAQVVSKVSTTAVGGTALDFSAGNVIDVTLVGNTTLNTPTNMVEGGRYIVILRQDATGGRTVTFGSDWLFNGVSGFPTIGRTIGTAANAVSMINVTVAGGKLLCQADINFA